MGGRLESKSKKSARRASVYTKPAMQEGKNNGEKTRKSSSHAERTKNPAPAKTPREEKPKGNG